MQHCSLLDNSYFELCVLKCVNECFGMILVSLLDNFSLELCHLDMQMGVSNVFEGNKNENK